MDLSPLKLGSRGRRVRAQARIVSGVLGIALVGSVFLPVYKGCDGTVDTGATILREDLDEKVAGLLTSPPTSGFEDLLPAAAFGILYVVGAAVSIAAVGRANRKLSWLLCGAIALFACGATRSIVVGQLLLQSPTWRDPTSNGWGHWTLDSEMYWPLWFAAICAWYLTRAARITLPLSLIVMSVVAGALLPTVAFFGPGLLYGAFVLAGCQAALLLSLGTEFVASLRRPSDAFRAFFCGTTEARAGLENECCANCDYPVSGLTSPRCPECGTERRPTNSAAALVAHE